MEDIKTGEYYHVLGYVGYKNENEVSVTFRNKLGVQTSIEFEPKEARKLLSPISEQPKYDPCRLFRKGDIVEPNAINGRLPEDLQGCYWYKVIVGEGDMSNPLYVSVKPLLAANYKHVSEIHVNVVFLKLVTPVEELEPYVICENDASYEVRLHSQKENHTMAIYNINAYGDWLKARYAAEAERDRLNAEYRKEPGK